MSRAVLAVLFGLSLALFGGGLAALLLLESKKPALPVLGSVPDFELRDENDTAFRSAERLHGKVWVANFVFTRCPTICPLFTRKMAEVQKHAEPLGDAVRLLSFTVDPAHDTPQILKAYAQQHRAKTGYWTFLTGSHEQLEKTIVTDMKIHMTDQSDDIMAIAHGGHFVLVDGQMRIRGYYNSEDEDAVQRLVKALEVVVEENP